MFDWFYDLSVLEKVFWVIASGFSVIFLIQLILTFIGIGGASDAEIDTDIGTDFDTDVDVGTDVDVDTDVDMDADVGADADMGADVDTDVDVDADADHPHVNDSDMTDYDRSKTSRKRRFKLLTFRGIVAFFMVFGWADIIAKNSGMNTLNSVLIASAMGLGMMFLISLIFYFLLGLTESGNIDIRNAVGSTGKVYLPIPAESQGFGKVQIIVQGAVREMDAITIGERLPTGTNIRVIGIVKGKLLVEEMEKK
jgi:hypothetical protein